MQQGAKIVLLSGLLLLPRLLSAQSLPQDANSITFGLGINSKDSYKFGQFSGIAQEGGFAVGQFQWQGEQERGNGHHNWLIKASNIGLKNSSFLASYGNSGHFKVYLSGEQLPHYRFNDGQTPFSNSGGAVQTLPTNWVAANSTAGFSALNESLSMVNIDKTRNRLTTGLQWQMSKHWELSSEYRHESKRGSETMGAIFGSTGGNPRGALLARPIDYLTDDISLGLSFNRKRSQFSVGYNAILFSNRSSRLRWQNPFDNPQWASGTGYSDGAVGEIALEPDTTSSQFSFSGAQTFADGSRLGGSVIATELNQDDSFLPYSKVIAANTPLPRTDLAGRIETLHTSLNYTKRLTRALRLRVRYRSDNRENKTPQNLYLRIAGDSAPQAELLSIGARINRLYDQQSDRVSTDLSYRLGGGHSVAFGFERETKDRSSVDVNTTHEDSEFFKYNFKLGITSNGWLRYSRSERRAGSYDSTIPLRSGHNPDFVATLLGNDLFDNDPLLRRYHLGDRNRDELTATLNFYPDAVFGASMLFKMSDDDYLRPPVGLQDSLRRNLALDFSYSPNSNWQAVLYYNLDRYDNHQAGFARRGGGNPTPFYPASVRDPGNSWQIASEDSVNSVGTSLDWSSEDSRLQLEIDVSYADAITATKPFSHGVNFQLLDDVTTLIRNISVQARYQLAGGRELKMKYFYENYQSSDWALDGIGVTSLPNVLLLGNQSPEYENHLLLIGYSIPVQ